MNAREKKLILILLGAGFIVANFFAYSMYESALQKKKVLLKNGADELKMKRNLLDESSKHLDEVDWLFDHMPSEGTHSSICADLVTFTEQSATKHRVVLKKRPRARREDPEEQGEFRTAIVEVQVNAQDPELYRWLVELQNPLKAQAITRLRITPQRDDKERIDCHVEITQWFIPISEDEPAEPKTSSNP